MTHVPRTSASSRTLAVWLVMSVPFVTAIAAQTPANVTFEVASVKANRSADPLQLFPTLQPGGRVAAFNLPLREWIRAAYGLEDNQLILTSPLGDARFDLDARAGTDTTRERAISMLQALLTERFKLRTHRETRRLPVYSLIRVNRTRLGPQMKMAAAECRPITFSAPDAAAPPPPPPPPPPDPGIPLVPPIAGLRCPTMFFPGGIVARAMNMSALSAALEAILERPVIDRTGLSGEFDFDLTYTPNVDGFPNGASSNAPGLPTALREQLGLRLESGRAQVQVFVVDDVRQPAEN